jgi:hypothetical protein
MARRQPREVHEYTADAVWAAAAYADRVNGGEYLREPENILNPDGTWQPGRPANKRLLANALTNPDLVTDADLNTGRDARHWHQGRSMMDGLRGELRDFRKTLFEAVSKTAFLSTETMFMAVIASQICAWRAGVSEEQARDDVVAGYLAEVGAKVRAPITVIRSVFSQNYNVFFVTAKTESRHIVFFSYRDRLEPGSKWKIAGTVKVHRDDSTQLNRVKVTA